jgi:hypothetical protein
MAAGLTDKPPTEAPDRGAFFRLVLGGFPETVLHPPLHRATQKQQSPVETGLSH